LSLQNEAIDKDREDIDVPNPVTQNATGTAVSRSLITAHCMNKSVNAVLPFGVSNLRC